MKLAERLGRRRAASRGYHSAIVTTFSVDFTGFEQVMLPQLAAAGATNVLLICDERMSALSLSDGSALPQYLGLDYALFGPSAARGVFHPKITLQLGRDGGRAFVGSANATAAGIGGNLEIVTEISCTPDASPERDFVVAAWRYVERVCGGVTGAAADAIAWARDRTPWLSSAPASDLQTLADGSLLAFLAAPADVGIADRFVRLIGDDRIERLFVISPYWDGELSALKGLSEALEYPKVNLLIDPDAHGLPYPVPAVPGLSLVDTSNWMTGRYKHAKLILAQSRDHDHVLAGSANCTIAGLGLPDAIGTNAEASVYRRVANGVAMEALHLKPLIDRMPVIELHPQRRADPIPLQAVHEYRPGRFEAEHGELRWYPPDRAWTGVIVLLDGEADEVGRLPLDQLQGEGAFRASRRDDLEEVHFVRIEDGLVTSTVAPLFHRGLMRSRRREAGSRSVAAAAAKFVGREDLQLFLLQALDELQRADTDDRPEGAIKGRLRDASIGAEAAERAVVLPYEQFVEQKSKSRRANGGESSLAGTHSDGVRDLLNRLAGVQERATRRDESASGQDWLDLGDEDQQTALEKDLAEAEGPQPADRNAFVKAVRAYEAAMSSTSARAIAGADVLRLRFWLMLLVHAARWDRYPGGLPCTADEFGWPRLVVRILAAFFHGRDAPIARLTVQSGHLDLPVDYLETWATALWLVDLLPGALGRCHGRAEFLRRVPALRECMLQRMGLTREELLGSTMMRVREGLDRDLGERLRDAARSHLKPRSVFAP